MKIIYASTCCSKEKYNEYIISKGQRNGQQAQKFNYLLAEGIVKNGVSVDVVSVRPINRETSKKIFWKEESDTENGINFHYVSFVNLPFLRNISVYLGTKKIIKKLSANERDVKVIVDGLAVSLSKAVLSVSKKLKIKNTCIVTDVPCHRPSDSKPPYSEKVALKQMRQFDSFLLLSEKMNEIVNKNGKPFVLIEGLVSADTLPKYSENISKYQEFTVLYAGNTCKRYGIMNLVDGFTMTNIPGRKLRIFGKGDLDDELLTISKNNNNVEFLGIAPNEKIIEEEIMATILVNPRPTNEEYTKYSFPSKNFEYMLSGTPILTTDLPGMTEDVKAHSIIIEEETPEGIRDALVKCYELGREKLNSFGEKAKDYVVLEKNNVKQAEKLLEMMKCR